MNLYTVYIYPFIDLLLDDGVFPLEPGRAGIAVVVTEHTVTVGKDGSFVQHQSPLQIVLTIPHIT